MQFFYSTFLFAICSVLADEAPFDLKGKPQKALLILPPQLTVQNNTTPQPVQNVTESVDNVTDNVLERFKQLRGSITNVYYISLPDGNVEKLEYIRIPTIGQQETQESQTQYPGPANYQQRFNQYSQSSEQPSSSTQQGNQQTNHQIVTGTNKHSNQANQQQYNEFQTQQQFGVSNLEEPQNTQFQRHLFSSQQNSYNKEVEPAEPNQAFAHYNAENSLNKPTSYVTSVRFTDVPPVHGPVYAYSTSPLVRIVRFANNAHQ